MSKKMAENIFEPPTSKAKLNTQISEVNMYNPVEMQGRFFVLNSFFRSYFLTNGLELMCAKYDSQNTASSTFTHIHNVLLCDIFVSWCKLFGVDSEECHWKNLVKDEVDFRKYLYSQLSITPNEFRAYQKQVLDFRNKWVVHYEPSYNHSVVPHFEHMYESALALHCYLRNHVSSDYGGPKCMKEFGEHVVKTFFNAFNEPQK